MKNVFEQIVLPIFGVFGTLLAILTFVLPDYAHIKVNLSIYAITIFLFSLAISVLAKIIIDKNRDIKEHFYFNNFSIIPIQFVNAESVLLIDRSISLPLNTTVSIFIKQGYYERIIGIGYVSHIQEKIIQVKIMSILNDTGIISYIQESNNLKSISIRPASNINDIIEVVRKETI